MTQAVLENQVLEVEAESLHEARTIARSKIPSGLVQFSETVLSDGGMKTEEATGDSVELAAAAARQKIPAECRVVNEETSKKESRETLTIQAFSLDSAKAQARQKTDKRTRIENLELQTPGRKGFLGLGKRPHTYEVKIFHPAVVRIHYRHTAKIRVEYGDPKDRSYKDGESVECGSCKRTVRVQYHDRGKIAIVDPQAIRSVALRCQSCGFVVCFSCSVGPAGEGIPTCPACKEQGGPYFFVR